MKRNCNHCGVEYTTFPSWRRSATGGRFCSHRCRRDAIPPRKCKGCGGDLPRDTHSRWCSDACWEEQRLRRCVDNFASKFTAGGKSECWLWRGDVGPAGYGDTKSNIYERYAHRFAWLLYVGDLPKDKCIAHVCGNRLCVNPTHLRAWTAGEAIRASVDAGRFHAWHDTGRRLDGSIAKPPGRQPRQRRRVA